MIFSGRNDYHHSEGVAIMMTPQVERSLPRWEPNNERIIKARFNTIYFICIECICAYAWSVYACLSLTVYIVFPFDYGNSETVPLYYEVNILVCLVTMKHRRCIISMFLHCYWTGQYTYSCIIICQVRHVQNRHIITTINIYLVSWHRPSCFLTDSFPDTLDHFYWWHSSIYRCWPFEYYFSQSVTSSSHLTFKIERR